MRKLIIVVLLFISNLYLNAQTQVDSLYSVWVNEKMSDSLRTDAYYNYIYTKYAEADLDTFILKAKELIAFGKQKNYLIAQSYGYEIIGEAYSQKEYLIQSLTNFKIALKLAEEAGIEDSSTILINSIGSMYSDSGNFVEGLKYFERGLEISKKIGDKETMEMCVSNIGGIYYMLENYPRALEYYKRGLQLEEEMKDTIGYATSLNLIGMVLIDQGEFKKAFDQIAKAIKIFEQQEDEQGVLESYYWLADIYKEQENYPLALQYFRKSLQVNSEEEEKEMEPNISVFYKMGSIYNELRKHSKAISLCKQSLELAIASGSLIDQLNAYECLYTAHRSLNKNKKALEYLEQSQSIEHSLKTQETNNRLQQMEIKKQMLKDSLASAKKNQIVELAHQEEVREKNKTRNIIIFIALFIFVIAGGLYSRWRSTQKSKNIIEKEKERSENLLLNILPADIAKELKEKGKADARDFELVSILFTDFKGFTEASEKLTAKELVSEINTCFKAFDQIMEKNKIEKIKTIGDAYMAAGGLPIPDKDAVKNTVLAGLEMQNFIVQRKKTHDSQNKMSFEMRVGIHTGPIVAGIVGVKKFQYDIWGDTVNTAARMESSGEVGKVNISHDTYELLKDCKEFRFEYRGKILAKGKGEIDMWFVDLA